MKQLSKTDRPWHIYMRVLKCSLFLIAIASTALASSASFDFETTSPGYYPGSLAVSNNGLTLTVTPQGDPTGFVDAANPSVALLGSVSLIGSSVDPLAFGGFDPLRFSFSQPVTSITFDFGDNGGDDDSPVVITAYDSGNNLLGTLTASYLSTDTSGGTLSGNFSDASYFILASGTQKAGSNSNSIYWEAPVVQFGSATSSTPEPSSLALVLCGPALLFLFRRKLSR